MIAPQAYSSGAARPPASSRAALAAALLRIYTPTHGALARALTVSVLAHAAVILAMLPGDTPQRPPASSLSVVLVNTRSEQPPFEPDALAQHDLHGGGEQAQGTASSPLPRSSDAPPSEEEALLLALQHQQALLEARQLALLAQLHARQASLAAAAARAPNDDGAAPEAAPDEAAAQLAALNARIALLDERVVQYSKRPRQHVTGPSARAVEHAAYVEAWRLRIEQLGTAHYPPEARGSIYGSLQLTAFIDREGQLRKIEIDRPSTHAVLNLAAQRIVQLAAPYPPFPPDLAAQLDVLAITRTWHFTREQLETEAP